MITVIGVRFRHAGKIYFFAPGELEIKAGEHVIVETARGIEYAEVRTGNHEVEDDAVTPPLKEVIRVATPEDTAHEEDNRRREKEAFVLCKQKIMEKELDMKLIYCEYTFDNSKILFYFTADGRVDFRDLVKELASVFRTRIELRQVGVRDETKLLGGLGSCGRPLCCATFLNDFAPVSIKMAKEQNLSLNPVKISGVCGRLMCCLGNEEEVYEELNKKLPGVGDLVDLADGGRGEVHSIGILKQLVKVVVELPGDEKEIREYPAEDVTVRVRRRDKNRMREAAERSEREARKERERLEKAGLREHGEYKPAEAVPGAAEGAVTEENTAAGTETADSNARNGKKEHGEHRDRGSREGRENRGQDGENRKNRDGGEKHGREGGEGRKNRDGEGRRNREEGENRKNREGGENRENRENRRNHGNREGAEAGGEPKEHSGEGRRDRRPRHHRGHGGEKPAAAGQAEAGGTSEN